MATFLEWCQSDGGSTIVVVRQGQKLLQNFYFLHALAHPGEKAIDKERDYIEQMVSNNVRVFSVQVPPSPPNNCNFFQ